MSKIYLAGPSSRREELLKYREDLINFNHEVVSRWLDGNDKEDTQEERNFAATKDLVDCLECTWFILFTPSLTTSGGAWVEFGYILGLERWSEVGRIRRKISIIGESTNIFIDLIASNEHYVSWENFIRRNFFV